MFNDKLQPLYDGKVLVNQSALENPVVQSVLKEMSLRNFEPQRINNYGVWYISDRHSMIGSFATPDGADWGEANIEEMNEVIEECN